MDRALRHARLADFGLAKDQARKQQHILRSRVCPGPFYWILLHPATQLVAGVWIGQLVLSAGEGLQDTWHHWDCGCSALNGWKHTEAQGAGLLLALPPLAKVGSPGYMAPELMMRPANESRLAGPGQQHPAKGPLASADASQLNLPFMC